MATGQEATIVVQREKLIRAEKLTLSGDGGPRRMLGPDGLPQLAEHPGCGWIILQPARTWQPERFWPQSRWWAQAQSSRPLGSWRHVQS